MSLLSFVGSSYAAGTCTVTYPSTYSTSIQKVLVSCTADSSAATYPNATVIAKRGWIFLAETNPGSTAPTAAYDIVVNNTNDADVMSGALGDRSASATERAVPAKSGWVDGGALTVVTSNNSVNSATFTLTLWIWIQD
jgi:hypothetical protein